MTPRRIRRLQVISPFGPGAIIDLSGESFVVEDAGRWRGRPNHVAFPRLAARLEVRSLWLPPAVGLPCYRFPRWLFCTSCRHLTYWKTRLEEKGRSPVCDVATCRGKKHPLVPMRFVAVCSNGHLTDVDWSRWAHSEPQTREQQHCRDDRKLRFLSHSGVGGGLESLEVECRTCEALRSLYRLTGRTGLQQVGIRCRGRQPWQSQEEAEDCDAQPVALQRGASSVYFPRVVSAIDIPPDSNWSAMNSPTAVLETNQNFDLLRNQPAHELREQLLGILEKETEFDRRTIEQELTRANAPDDPGTLDDIMPDEWAALCHPPDEHHHPRDNFITRTSDWTSPSEQDERHSPAELQAVINDVVLVDRLREVRVLRGFERHNMQREIPSNLASQPNHLPAVEVFGEGFFLRFGEDRLTEWERRNDVRSWCETLENRRAANGHWLPVATPRFVMLHTLSHLLLRNTAFDAGYSTSALRERIYTTQDDGGPAMAGILAYTAAGDTEGTLGGLVRMGEEKRLSQLLIGSVAEARWCSFDPVCWESSGQGVGGLSLAACHACGLVPETSCTAANRLLDRRLLLDPEFGFLSPLLQEIDLLAQDAPR